MKAIETLFDNIGKAITSLAAVIFVMLMTITGMIFFSHTLFNHVFPASMETWEKLTATWLMALGWEFTVLLTTVNTKHINRHIPAIMAVCSGIIVLFFIQAFDVSLGWLTVVQKWFVGLLAATINYIYAELFYAKWQERNIAQQLPSRLVEHERTLIETRTEAERTLNQLQSRLNQAQSEYEERGREMKNIHAELAERRLQVAELERYKAKVEGDLTCPHCKVVQESYGTLQAHKGYCEQNPNKRGAKKLNGTTQSPLP